MALRTPSPMPDDPDEMPDDPHDPLDQPVDEDEEVLGPVPEVTEGWEEAANEGESEENGPENGEDSAQPGDPDGVSRDMATAALDRGMLPGGLAVGSGGTLASAGDWRAMTDAEIMLRVREGDDGGFNFLIEKYRKAIVNFMYRMVHNQAVAEELAQEVFLRVYRSRQTYRAEAKFTTWLYRIATNLGVNHARDTKQERAAQTIYLDQPDPETGTTPDVADLHPGAEEEMVKDERMRRSASIDGAAGAAATFYWIALVDSTDRTHQRDRALTSERVDSAIITTEAHALPAHHRQGKCAKRLGVRSRQLPPCLFPP